MKRSIFLLIMIVAVLGCKKPYNPPATTTNYNYLVVEGTINNSDSTIIKLSRTVTISTNSTTNPELNAQVAIQNDQNSSFALKSLGNGLYGIAAITLDNTRTYRLDIKTTDGKEYASDYVAVKNSPPIDSITYQFTATQANIFSYTHDATNNTRYYRWQYQETYLYNSPIFSNYEYKHGTVIKRPPADEVYTCYITDNSSNIILNSSAKLIQDVINKNPITQIPFNTDQLKIRYSILVKQYALTPDAFNYYTNLAKNTEQLGSIFDALPSEISGNIHCLTAPGQPVIGYISVGSVAQVRIFIDRSQIPPAVIGATYDCGTAVESYTGSFYPIPAELTKAFEIPLDTIAKGYDAKAKDSVFSFPYATADCTVCTLKGTSVKPAFWQ